MRIKSIFSALIFLVLLLSLPFQLCYSSYLTLNNTPLSVYFSPNGGCTNDIVKQIDNAKSEILVQAYSFTSTTIAKALLEAHKRGVKVEAILDKSQKTQKYSGAIFLANSCHERPDAMRINTLYTYLFFGHPTKEQSVTRSRRDEDPSISHRQPRRFGYEISWRLNNRFITTVFL